MAILQATEHRCWQCEAWSANWHQCPLARDASASRLTGLISTSRKEPSRATRDEAFSQDFNQRVGAILDWWMAHRLGPYNENHVVAVALDFADIPVGELIAILERTIDRARQRPRTLRYFKVALEEGRGAFFKRQSRDERRGGPSRSAGDILAEHPEWYGGQGGGQ